MKTKTIKYSAPDIDIWIPGLESLLCQSSGQMEGLIPDETEGITF